MTSSRTSRRPLVYALVLGGLAVVAWLAFGVFGIHTAFIDDKVDEALPEFDTAPAAAEGDDTESDSAPDPDVADDAPEAAPDGAVEPSILTVAEGSFVDRSHPTSGAAIVLTDGTEQRFLRFEDFETDNGPDLNVYLSTASPDAPADQFDDDFVDLGDLSGNIGNQNYELPADVDLSRYRTVVIWCVRFGVAFGAAELTVA